MGKLEKYAKKPAARRSKSLSTKLSQQEYQDFLAYIKPLGLNTAEAIRFLILEEIYNEDQSVSIPEFIYTDQKSDQGRPKKDSVSYSLKPKKTKVNTKTSKVNVRETSAYLQRFKVNGKLPCPVCRSWSSAGHYKKRHAEKHAGVSSAEFLKQHEGKALQMVDVLLSRIQAK